MALDTKAPRQTMTLEKSKSLSFSLRVEDRLHIDVLQPTDRALFTIRQGEYSLIAGDTDITVSTSSTSGSGVKADGVLTTDPVTGDKLMVFSVQAAALNLDPELEYWYDISYIRDGYAMSVLSGPCVIVANPASRTGSSVFSESTRVQDIIATLDGSNQLTVSATMPLPQKGDPGNGSYLTSLALATSVGSSVTVPLTSITAPNSRPVQIGDVLFSSVTPGVLGTVTSISTTTTPQATVMTRQVFSKEALKALLDTKFRQTPVGGGASWETIDFIWTADQADVPLPEGYEYNVGDFVFSHCGFTMSSRQKKLLISLVTGVNATTLTLQTKIVFDVFMDSTTDWTDLLKDLVPSSRKVNSKTLVTDITLTMTDLADTASFVRMTSTERAKLNALPTSTAIASMLAGKADSSHSHTIAEVTGLQTALNGKVSSTTASKIWVGTSAQLAAQTIDPTTLYFVKE